MKKILVLLLIGLGTSGIISSEAAAHCEIPCGIYDDRARIALLLEHTATIEKSMKQIVAIEKQSPPNYNQLVRWVVNKERHAEELQEIVWQYFMTQRIKLDAKDYGPKLGLLHQVLVYAMKCKQTTDVANIDKLREAIKAFESLYFK
jgi:nickel superoxide dismutase